MVKIRFTIQIREINSRRIIHLPAVHSKKLSSLGIVMVMGTMNGTLFEAALETNGFQIL